MIDCSAHQHERNASTLQNNTIQYNYNYNYNTGKSLLYIENNNNDNTNNKTEDATESSSCSGRNDETHYHWTRHKLETRIDRVLAYVHRQILGAAAVAADDDNDDEQDNETTTAPRNEEDDDPDHQGVGWTQPLEKQKGLILFKNQQEAKVGSEERTTTTTSPASSTDPLKKTMTIPRKKLLDDLARYCTGIAIPLESSPPPNHHTTTTNMDDHTSDEDPCPVLGAALVGHGGGRRVVVGREKKSGSSKRPIIVSVGHQLSLTAAVAIVATLSHFRIPEPVRQADLYGRELLRHRKKE